MKAKAIQPSTPTLFRRLWATFGWGYNAMPKPNFVLTLLRSKFGINHSFLVYSLHSKEYCYPCLFDCLIFRHFLPSNSIARLEALPIFFLIYTRKLLRSQSPHAHFQLWLFCARLISVLKRRDLLPSNHRAHPSIRLEILLLSQFLSAQSS